jgi:hypothetical protein
MVMSQITRMFRLAQAGLYLAGLVMVFLTTTAHASSPDVGLVTSLTGGVSFWNAADQKEPTPVQAFMKVRQGDHFKLSSGSQVQLLYCASGRQETWTGPAIFSAGEQKGQTVDNKTTAQPEIKIVPPKVSKRIIEAPIPFPRCNIRYSGVIQTMTPGCPASSNAPVSPEARLQIVKEEAVYRDLQKEAKAGDLTPELYLLGVYAEYSQYAKMEKVIDAMREKQPGNTTLKELKAWAHNQSSLPTTDPEKKR